MKRGLLALVLAALVALAPANVTADDDHERARRAFESGEIVGLRQILGRVQSTYQGKILEIELRERRRDGWGPPWVYMVKVLTPQGHVLALELDAKTTRVLRVRGRGGDRDDFEREKKKRKRGHDD